MVNSYVYYTGDGSTTNFQITFDYLSNEFVQVYLDGTLLDVETDYIFAGDRTILIPSIPSSGSIVFIRRVTAKDRLVEFRDASILVANDLDVSALQAIHIAEEANDNIQNVIQADALGNFDALNRRLVNVGDPVDGTDGTNKLYVDTRFTADVSAAVAARDAAANSAIEALGYRNAAQYGATEALGYRNTTIYHANAAAQSAQAAQAARLAAEAISIEAAARAYNHIINGNFDIWQRGTSQSTSGYASADRWICANTGTTKTASRQAFTLGQTEVDGDPKYFMRHVVNSVAGSNNECKMLHRLESVTALAGKKATLSFWAKADSPKNIAIEFVQYFGGGGTSSSPVECIGSQLVALTTSWAKYTVTVDIPSIAGKILGTNGYDYLQLNFYFDAGTFFATKAAGLGHQSGTFDIACVSLIEGDIDVKPIPHSYGKELASCQRYCCKLTLFQRFPSPYAGAIAGSLFNFPVPMRVGPTVSAVSGVDQLNCSNIYINVMNNLQVKYEVGAITSGDCYRGEVRIFDSEL